MTLSNEMPRYPVTTWNPDGYKVLKEDFYLNGDKVKAGQRINGASVPSLLHFYADDDGELFPASIVHDEDYDSNPRGRTRGEADDRFYSNMILTGVRFTKAWAAWAGVRTFGWMFYKGGKQDD